MRDGYVLAIPLPPPFAGPEVASVAVADAARARWGPRVKIVDVTVSRSNSEKGRVTLGKVLALVKIMWQLIPHAARSRAVYVHLAQNSSGLVRDAMLIGAARLMGAKVVAHLHGGALADAKIPKPLLKLLRLLLRGQTGIALSNTLIRHVRHVVRDGNIVVVENGVRIPSRVPPLPCTRPGDGALRLVYVSTLTAEKGYRELVDAAAMVNATTGGVHLTLVGPTSRQEDAEWLRGALKRHSWLVYQGPVPHPEVERYIAASDVLALVPLRQEGAPLCVLEAMALGRPVIVSNSGALPELVGEAGWIVEASSRGIEQGIRQVLSAREELPSRGEELRKRCQAMFNESTSTSKLLTVLQGI